MYVYNILYTRGIHILSNIKSETRGLDHYKWRPKTFIVLF